jgi:hypothetical protein
LKLLFLILLQYVFIVKEELYALSSSPNIIRLIKSRRIRWAENVARIEGTREEYTGLLWGNVRERDHLEELGIDGRIILNGCFGSWMGRQVLDCPGSEQGQVDGCCECGIEP